MDILNFISWIRGRRQVTTVDPAKTLIPIGLKDGRRDDGYLAAAITVQDLAAQIAPQPTYKVYTALLTQSGGSIVNYLYSGSLVKGVSYTVTSATSNCDFTNVGGPIGVSGAGLSFVATENLEPNNWDGSELEYNSGAPVVTVLENTVGNITWTYLGTGSYAGNLISAFPLNKTYFSVNNRFSDDGGASAYDAFLFRADDDLFALTLWSNGTQSDNLIFSGSPISIEIRVYN
jgi:hypothetical protein